VLVLLVRLLLVRIVKILAMLFTSDERAIAYSPFSPMERSPRDLLLLSARTGARIVSSEAANRRGTNHMSTRGKMRVALRDKMPKNKAALIEWLGLV